MTHTPDFWQAVGSIGTLVVSGAAVIVLIVQVRKLRETIQGDTFGRLYAQDSDITHLFLSYPELRPYFYEGHDVDRLEPDSPELARVKAAAEVLCDYFDHVALQMQCMPKDAQETWRSYVVSIHASSPIIQRFLGENPSWYSEALKRIVREGDTT